MPFSGLVEVTDWVGNVKRQFLHRNDSVFDVARPDTNATWTENCVSVPVYGWITTSYVGGPGHLYPSSQRWGIIDYQTVCSFTQVVTYEGCFDCGTYVPGGGGGGSGDGDNRQPTIEIDDEDVYPCEVGFISVDNECLKISLSLDDEQDPNDCEQAMIMMMPWAVPSLLINKDLAINSTFNVFGPINAHNNCADAFRHAMYNALNTQSVGADVAQLFGDAHECGVPLNELLEKEMDLHNNAVGRQIGSSNPNASNDELALLIINAMANGQLKHINGLDQFNRITASSELVSTFDCF
jgi:hypothetical protein